LAIAYLQRADFDAAIAELDAALKLAPDDASLHYNLGLAYKLKDLLDKAVLEFQNAIRLQPGLADAHYTLGVLFWQRGEFDKATAELQTAIQNQPNYAEAYYTLGTIFKQQAKLPEAAAALREAIRLQPDFAGAHTTLAAVLRQLGDTQGAAEEAKLGATIAASTKNLQAATFSTNSGKRLLDAGDVDGAITQFRSAINSAPNYAAAHYQLAMALSQQGHKDEATKELQKAVELDPHFASPR
jgi:tetratricopeptide (TPR) repeat protein